MKIENKIINIKDEIYHGNIILILASREEISKVVKSRWIYEYVPELHHDAESFDIQGKKSGFISYIIWMKSFDWTLDDQSTLVHEIFHTVSRILTDRGVKFDPENTEPFVYYFDWVFGKLWNELKKLYQKKRN